MKILLVDDSKYESAVISAQLHQMGHEVAIVENGQQAIDVYARVEPDIILMDVMMPQMDGHTAARRLRQDNRDWVPIIFLSGRVDPDDIVAGIHAGGDDYLTKPVNPRVLEAKMIAMQRIAAMRHQLLDVTDELEIANVELRQLVNMDGLTGLSNRRFMDKHCRDNCGFLGTIRCCGASDASLLGVDFVRRRFESCNLENELDP